MCPKCRRPKCQAPDPSSFSSLSPRRNFWFGHSSQPCLTLNLNPVGGGGGECVRLRHIIMPMITEETCIPASRNKNLINCVDSSPPISISISLHLHPNNSWFMGQEEHWVTGLEFPMISHLSGFLPCHTTQLRRWAKEPLSLFWHVREDPWQITIYDMTKSETTTRHKNGKWDGIQFTNYKWGIVEFQHKKFFWRHKHVVVVTRLKLFWCPSTAQKG